jgi:hypothetical protein
MKLVSKILVIAVEVLLTAIAAILLNQKNMTTELFIVIVAGFLLITFTIFFLVLLNKINALDKYVDVHTDKFDLFLTIEREITLRQLMFVWQTLKGGNPTEPKHWLSDYEMELLKRIERMNNENIDEIVKQFNSFSFNK